MAMEIRLSSMTYRVNATSACAARGLARQCMWDDVLFPDEVLTGREAEDFALPPDEGGDDARMGEWEVKVTRVGYAEGGSEHGSDEWVSDISFVSHVPAARADASESGVDWDGMARSAMEGGCLESATEKASWDAPRKPGI